MKRAIRLLATLTGLALALVGTMAVAAWLSSGSASATASATSVNKANQPSASRGSSQVSLSWAASTLAHGAPAGGYRVVRHAASTTTTVCTVVAPAHSCIDSLPLATSVSYGVVATVGTSWRGSESDLTSFTYDDVAPVTTADVSPAPNSATWNHDQVTVTLSAVDNGSPNSGVDHIHYSVDGGSPVDHAGSTAAFPVSGAGTHTVTYFAVDGAGNAETAHGTTVRIDPSAPVTTASPNVAPNAAGWNNTPVTLSFSAVDVDASGVKSVTVDGVTTAGSTASKVVSSEGTTTVSYFATDVADNIEGTKSTTVKIDTVKPTAAISPASSASWIQQGSQSVTITGADTTSGVAAVVYRIDSGSTITVNSGSTTFSLGQGDHTITYHAVDAAGNIQADQSATIRLDNVVPTSSIAATTATTWTITATDANPSSGVSIEYWIDSGAHTTVSGTSAVVTVPTGSHTIRWFAKDVAGNQQVQQNLGVTVGDSTAPGFGTTYPSGGNFAQTNPFTASPCGSGRVCATVTDAGTGVASVTYTITADNGKCWTGSTFGNGPCAANSMSLFTGTAANGVWRSGTTAITPLVSGNNRGYTLVFTATDGQGNVSTTTVAFTSS